LYIKKAFKYVRELYECILSRDFQNTVKNFTLFSKISKGILVNHFNDNDMSIK
jgi:hypothetical protein